MTRQRSNKAFNVKKYSWEPFLNGSHFFLVAKEATVLFE